MDTTTDAVKIDHFQRSTQQWRPVGRSVGVESMADPAGGSTQVSNLIIPVHRQRPRDSFRSRDLCLRRPARDASTSKMLSSTETKRQRRHKRSNLTRVRSCEGKLQPVWRQQRTNSWHGSPDGQTNEAGWPTWTARRAGSRGRPFGESSPLRATFLMLPRSRGAIGRVRAAPGAPPVAGRSTDGPDGVRSDLPARERG